MIGKAFVALDVRFAHGRGEIRRDELIVDSPAEIALEGLRPVRPPGILLGLVIDRTERIDPTDPVDNGIEPGAFIWQKAGRTRIRFGVENVDLVVRDIEVAAENDRTTLGAHRDKICKEAIEKAVLDRLTRRACCARRHVQ